MLKFLMLISGIPLALVSHAADLNYPNRYGTMANSMFDMMDAFSSAYQKRMGEAGSNQTPTTTQWPQSGNMPWPQSNPWSMGGMGGMPWASGGMPWSQGNMPWSQGNMPWSQGNVPGVPGYGQQMLPPFGGGNPALFTQGPTVSTPLDGSWRGRSGEVLVIHNGQFRIYLNRKDYREGSLRLSGTDRLSMLDPASGTTRQYQYAEHQGKLVLQDKDGNLLLYRRIE